MLNEIRPVIYIFTPHPDDETLACGGTIVKKLASGNVVKIIVMTDGSHSHSTVLGIWENPTPDELAAIRKKEIIRATSILGVSPNLVLFLDQEDGFLSQNENQMIEKVKSIIKKEKIISEVYLPHAMDQHKDHQATNRIVLKAIEDLKFTPDVYFYIIWTDQESQVPGQAISVDISEVLPIKKKAILEYKSQIGSISSKQDQPILDTSFLEKFMMGNNEEFWLRNKIKQ